MKFYLFNNFYKSSTKVLSTRFYYQSKKFKFKNFPLQNPIKEIKFRLTTRWSSKIIYFIWDFLRTSFYFQRFFLRRPDVRLHNSKYLELTLSFPTNDVATNFLINYLSYYRKRFPKLLTKNYLLSTNIYTLDFRESQTQAALPKNTIFDFYNWKNKVPLFIFPNFLNSTNSKTLTRPFYYFSRLYYVQLYNQLFLYKNFKNLCDIFIRVRFGILSTQHRFHSIFCCLRQFLIFCDIQFMFHLSLNLFRSKFFLVLKFFSL